MSKYQHPMKILQTGVPWMIGAILSFVLMATAARELSSALNAIQILFWRSLTGALLMPILLSFFGWHHIKSKRPGLQVLRGGIHFIAQYGWFFGITMIPLAHVFALEFTAPVWTVIFASIFLSERLSLGRLLSVGAGFIGVLIVLRPGLQTIEPAAVIVLGSAALYAITYVMVKTLTKTDSPLCIMFFMSLVQLILAFLAVTFDWAVPSMDLWPWIILVGASGLSAHYCMAQALSKSDAATVMPIDFFRLPIIMVVGYWLYSEGVDPWVFVGAFIIFVGNYSNLRYELNTGRVTR